MSHKKLNAYVKIGKANARMHNDIAKVRGFRSNDVKIGRSAPKYWSTTKHGVVMKSIWTELVQKWSVEPNEAIRIRSCG